MLAASVCNPTGSGVALHGAGPFWPSVRPCPYTSAPLRSSIGFRFETCGVAKIRGMIASVCGWPQSKQSIRVLQPGEWNSRPRIQLMRYLSTPPIPVAVVSDSQDHFNSLVTQAVRCPPHRAAPCLLLPPSDRNMRHAPRPSPCIVLREDRETRSSPRETSARGAPLGVLAPCLCRFGSSCSCFAQ